MPPRHVDWKEIELVHLAQRVTSWVTTAKPVSNLCFTQLLDASDLVWLVFEPIGGWGCFEKSEQPFL
jgi:aspartyl-tRNA synthetase